MPHWYAHYVLPGIFLLLTIFLLGVGLRGILTRRPFVMSARWLLAFVLLSFSPNLLMPLVSRLGEGGGSLSHSAIVWAGPVMFVVLSVFFWIAMRGYIVFCVTEDSLRESLTAVLGELQLPHEMSLGAVRLPTVPADMQVSVQGWLGTGQLKARQRAGAPVVGQIVAGLARRFRTTDVKVNLTCCIFYVVMAIILAALNIALFAM